MWLNMELSGNGRYQKGRVRVPVNIGVRSITYHAKQFAGLNGTPSRTTKRFGMYLVGCDRGGVDIQCWLTPETAEEKYYETLKENRNYVWHKKSKYN